MQTQVCHSAEPLTALPIEGLAADSWSAQFGSSATHLHRGKIHLAMHNHMANEGHSAEQWPIV